jgi:hypothetical protein
MQPVNQIFSADEQSGINQHLNRDLEALYNEGVTRAGAKAMSEIPEKEARCAV